MCKKITQQNNTKMPDLAGLATLYNYGKTRMSQRFALNDRVAGSSHDLVTGPSDWIGCIADRTLSLYFSFTLKLLVI